MTISTQTRTAGPFTTNGSTTAFPFAFKCFAASDIVVVRRVTATGVESNLVLNTDYTVSLNANQDANPGGTVNTVGALGAGFTLTLTTNLQYLQPTDLTNQGGFYPKVITTALDRLTIFTQQLFGLANRALKFPISDGNLDATVPGKDQRKGTVLAFHETTGLPVVGPNIATVGTVAGNIAAVKTVADNIGDVQLVADYADEVANFNATYQGPKATDPSLRNDGTALQQGDLYFNTNSKRLRVYTGSRWSEANTGSVSVQTFTGNGATTSFQLNAAPDNENVVQVFVGGVYQSKSVYDLTGTNSDILTFVSAPPNGVSIEAVTFSVLPLGVVDASQVQMAGGGTLDQLASADSTLLVGGVAAGDIGTVVNGLKGLKPNNGKRQFVKGIVSGLPYGAGSFYYDSTVPKSFHNGGTIIAPEAITAWNGTYAGVGTLVNWTGSGSGCYVRVIADSPINILMFGADPSGVADSTASVQACFNAAKKIALSITTYGISVSVPKGVYRTTGTITVPQYVNPVGESVSGSIFECRFNADAFVDETVVGGQTATWYFSRFENISIFKSDVDGSNNTTGVAIRCRPYTTYNRFGPLRIYGGQYGIFVENVGYSLWNTWNKVVCYRQTIASIYKGQGSSADDFYSCSMAYAPICLDMAGTSFAVSMHGSAFEGFTNCAIQIGSGQLSLHGGYSEQYAADIDFIKATGTAQVDVVGMYLKGSSSGLSYLANLTGNARVTFDKCQIVDFNGNPPVRGAFAANVNFGDNECRGLTNKLAKGVEYGTFTPTLTPTVAGNFSITYSRQLGRYTKVGKRVTVDIDIAASAFTHSTAGGYMRIQGLPYNCSSTTGVQSLGSVVFSGVNKAGYSQVCASIDATNPTQVILFASGMGVTESLITPADMPSGSAKSIRLTLSYEVAW